MENDYDEKPVVYPLAPYVSYSETNGSCTRTRDHRTPFCIYSKGGEGGEGELWHQTLRDNALYTSV